MIKFIADTGVINFIIPWVMVGAWVWSKTDHKIQYWLKEKIKELPKDATQDQIDGVFRTAAKLRWGSFLLWPIALMVP